MATIDEVRVKLDNIIDERAQAIARRLAADATRNLAGNGGMWLGTGSPFETITPSTTNSQLHGYTVRACQIDEVHLSGMTNAGSAVVDVWVARPGQPITAATSIFAGIYPTISGGHEAHYTRLQVKANGWTAFIERGSWVAYFVRSVSGFETVGITLGARLFLS